MTAGARITDYLSADHRRLHLLLVRACEGTSIDREAYASFRTGLLRHIAIEEKVLFPAVRVACGGSPLSRAPELRVDHAAIVSLLVPTPDHALCADLGALLDRHDALEEEPGGIYQECELALGEARSGRLAEQARLYREIRVTDHFDGPTVHRTAAVALASARRRPPRPGEP